MIEIESSGSGERGGGQVSKGEDGDVQSQGWGMVMHGMEHCVCLYPPTLTAVVAASESKFALGRILCIFLERERVHASRVEGQRERLREKISSMKPDAGLEPMNPEIMT